MARELKHGESSADILETRRQFVLIFITDFEILYNEFCCVPVLGVRFFLYAALSLFIAGKKLRMCVRAHGYVWSISVHKSLIFYTVQFTKYGDGGIMGNNDCIEA